MEEIERARALFESLESKRANSFEVALRAFKIKKALSEIKA